MFLFYDTKMAVLLDGLVFNATPAITSTTEVVLPGYNWLGYRRRLKAAAAIIFYYKKESRLKPRLPFCFCRRCSDWEPFPLIGYRPSRRGNGGVSPPTKWGFPERMVNMLVFLNFATSFLVAFFDYRTNPADRTFHRHERRTALALSPSCRSFTNLIRVGRSAIKPMATLDSYRRSRVPARALKDSRRFFRAQFGLSSYTDWRRRRLLILILAGTSRNYWSRIYRQPIFSNLPGATRMRLSKPAETWLVMNFHMNAQFNCDLFVSMPGLMSFNFWAKKETPTTFNVTE